jgi:hypothetical protein
MAAQRGDESTISVKRAGRKRAASRSRLMIEDHLMTPPVSQIASGAPDPIKLGARKMGGNLGSIGTRETAHYAISHGACVRFRTNCAIPEGQPADLRHHVPACATRVAQRISLGMSRHKLVFGLIGLPFCPKGFKGLGDGCTTAVPLADRKTRT